ncbi:MAG: hypothetical protein ACTSWW_08665 [Promethearchaeota archaeon]
MEGKCHHCQKKTDLTCHRCKLPICSKHAYDIHHRFYCVNCYARERKVGMFKGWTLLFLLMSAGILVIVLLQQSRV